MNIEEILSQFEEADQVVPVTALTAAMERPAEIIPSLVNILEYTAAHGDELADRKYPAPIFAMVLMAQFRAKEAYEPIYKIFSIPGDTSLELTGDFVTEYLMRILASVCCGDLTLIQKLIEDKAVNVYVRSAALRSFLVLFAADEMYQDEVVEYYQVLFAAKLERKPSLIWCTLVDCCSEIHATELAPDIEQAFEENLVDREVVSLAQIKKSFETEKNQILETLLRNPAYHIIEDAVFELVDS